MKETLRQIVVLTVGILALVMGSALISIHGWGLTPQNWWVIIGGGFIIPILSAAIAKLGSD